jgi:CDP-glucose 4,6-dehydratase
MIKNQSWLFLQESFKGKKVVVTGHTGFKGSWLCFTLKILGAEVWGVSNSIPENSNHAYHALKVGQAIENPLDLYDIRDTSFYSLLDRIKPDFIFHLAAQAIVSTSFNDPYRTHTTNILGTLNILEYLRINDPGITAIIVTSDKCYLNDGRKSAYREFDNLGGEDPYSASKASAEIIFQSYLASFPQFQERVGIASARAGNVIGGGDWSENRLIPDAVRNFSTFKPLTLRMPEATRPWTLVNDVILGYLILAGKLRLEPKNYRRSWNFASGENMTVYEVVQHLSKCFDNPKILVDRNESVGIESELLQIDPTDAREILGWSCISSLKEVIKESGQWYKAQFDGRDMFDYSRDFLQSKYGS